LDLVQKSLLLYSFTLPDWASIFLVKFLPVAYVVYKVQQHLSKVVLSASAPPSPTCFRKSRRKWYHRSSLSAGLWLASSQPRRRKLLPDLWKKRPPLALPIRKLSFWPILTQWDSLFLERQPQLLLSKLWGSLSLIQRFFFDKLCIWGFCQ